jgi:hypothetical protein
MKRIRRVMLLALTLLAVATPVTAQSAVELEATIGLHGYVVPYEPSTVSVQVHADVLFVGDLQTTAGGVSLFTPIEVPAGSTKQYTVEIPAVGPSSRVTVRLFVDGAEEHLVQESVNVLFPGEKPLVGLLNASGIEGALSEVTSVPFGKDLAILNVTAEDLDVDIAPLGYLVAGRGAFDAATPDAIDAVSAWVKGGGRLVGEAREVAGIGSGGDISLTGGVSSAALGAGELITVDDIAAVSTWSPAIRDIPPLAFSSTNNDFITDFGFQMFQAAAAAGDSATPGIPWLFAALTVYVILVGPVNFLVLRRFKRRELAWITIPAVSLLMLIVLWAAGRTQVDSRIVTHASVMVQEGNAGRATSAMIVVAGAGGEHSVDAPAGWSLAPVDASMMFGRASGVEARVGPADAGGTRLTFDMPDLGAATLQAAWNPEPIAVTADLVADGDDLKLTVVNRSPFEFWAWGIGTSSSAVAAAGTLARDQTDTVTLGASGVRPGGGSPIGDAVMSRGNWGWDEEPWDKVWPLGETAGRQEAATLRAGPYFFGYTDDLTADVVVDGHVEQAHGPALIIIPLDPPDGVVLSRGVAEVIQVVGADFVDSYPGSLYASGADAIELRFGVTPDSDGQARVDNQFANLPGVAGFEVYNWQSGEFDEYQWLKEFPLSGHVSPTGELMTRVSFEQTQFSDMDLPDNSLTLSMVSS